MTSLNNNNSDDNNNTDDDDMITITIVNNIGVQQQQQQPSSSLSSSDNNNINNSISESLTISSKSTTIQEFIEFSCALLSIDIASHNNNDLQFTKDDGTVLFTSSLSSSNNESKSKLSSLYDMNIRNHDMIVISSLRNRNDTANTGGAMTSSSPLLTTSTAATSGGLDFTSLLQQHNSTSSSSSSSGGVTTAAAGTSTTTANTTTNNNNNSNNNIMINYHGENMNLQEAQYYNPHPQSMIQLLFTKDHLMKECNYYAPQLAQQLILLQQQYNNNTNTNQITERNGIFTKAVQIYRDYMVTQSIQTAVQRTTKYHVQHDMEMRYQQNPNDIVASQYIQKQQQLQFIQDQYELVMNEYPESLFGNVLMLYIPIHINGIVIQAFCDSGAQQTIMSYSCTKKCLIDHLIDTRMAGIAIGVGTGKILGRIHMVQIEITTTTTSSTSTTTATADDDQTIEQQPQQKYYFPCSITVMEDPKPIPDEYDIDVMDHDDNNNNNNDTMMKDASTTTTVTKAKKNGSTSSSSSGKEMPFLLGLDMMKRHLMNINIQKGCLQFTQIIINTTTNECLEVPFLHEKDLLPSQGGTKRKE